MNKTVTSRAIRHGVALALYSGMWANAQSAGLDKPVDFHIPAEPMPPALMQFSDQAHVQVVSQSEGMSHSRTHGVSGRMRARKGLDRLLKDTRFSYTLVGERTVAIKEPVAFQTSLRRPRVAETGNRLSQRKTYAPAQPISKFQKQRDPQSPANLGTVQVTGTRIRRTSLETSQVVTRLNRKQLEATGLTSVGEILHRITKVDPIVKTSYRRI